MSIVMLYATFPEIETARTAARALVEGKLAACANIFGQIESVFHWEGKLHNEPESAMVAKTTADNADAAIALVKSLHPYELPCIVTLPLSGGLPPFLNWVAGEVRS